MIGGPLNRVPPLKAPFARGLVACFLRVRGTGGCIYLILARGGEGTGAETTSAVWGVSLAGTGKQKKHRPPSGLRRSSRATRRS